LVSNIVTEYRQGDCALGLIIKSYLIYNQIPASLYRKVIVETDGKKYRLRIWEGEVKGSQPYELVEMSSHSRLYVGEKEATEAAEILLRKFESVGWHLSSPALDS
jgi:hypothetical protein